MLLKLWVRKSEIKSECVRLNHRRMLKHTLDKHGGRVWSKLDLSGSRQYYEHTIDVSDIRKDAELLDQINNCELLKSLLHEISYMTPYHIHCIYCVNLKYVVLL